MDKEVLNEKPEEQKSTTASIVNRTNASTKPDENKALIQWINNCEQGSDLRVTNAVTISRQTCQR